MNPEKENPEPSKTIAQAVNEAEIDAAFSGPAIYANKFYITVSGFGARVAFAEQVEGRLPVFRNAVLLSLSDAITLSKVLQELIKEVQLEASNSTQANNG